MSTGGVEGVDAGLEAHEHDDAEAHGDEAGDREHDREDLVRHRTSAEGQPDGETHERVAQHAARERDDQAILDGIFTESFRHEDLRLELRRQIWR